MIILALCFFFLSYFIYLLLLSYAFCLRKICEVQQVHAWSKEKQMVQKQLELLAGIQCIFVLFFIFIFIGRQWNLFNLQVVVLAVAAAV